MKTYLEALTLDVCEPVHNKVTESHDYPCGLSLADEVADQSAGDWELMLFTVHKAHHQYGHPRHTPWPRQQWELYATTEYKDGVTVPVSVRCPTP